MTETEKEGSGEAREGEKKGRRGRERGQGVCVTREGGEDRGGR